MKYKAKISELKANREKYFPLMEALLYVESKTDTKDLPIKMTDSPQIALLMELIDIGYVDKDSFVIDRNRSDITGVFYRGGYPLTGSGIEVYRRHLHERRGKFIRGIMLAVLALLGMIVFYMMTKH